MKKLLCLVLMAAMLLSLVGCNAGMADFNLQFDYALIEMPGGEVEKVEIRKWYDYENSDQVQVVATDGTVYCTHTENCVLIHEGKGESK